MAGHHIPTAMPPALNPGGPPLVAPASLGVPLSAPLNPVAAINSAVLAAALAASSAVSSHVTPPGMMPMPPLMPLVAPSAPMPYAHLHHPHAHPQAHAHMQHPSVHGAAAAAAAAATASASASGAGMGMHGMQMPVMLEGKEAAIATAELAAKLERLQNNPPAKQPRKQKRGPYVRLTTEERALIIKSVDQGLSIPTIISASGGRFKESSVRSLVQHWRTTGSIERKLNTPGRKRMITPDIQNALSRWIDDNPKLTLLELVDRVRQHFGVFVSSSTMNSAIRHQRNAARQDLTHDDTPKNKRRRPFTVADADAADLPSDEEEDELGIKKVKPNPPDLSLLLSPNASGSAGSGYGSPTGASASGSGGAGPVWKNARPINEWSTSEVAEWIRSIGPKFALYAPAFEENGMNGTALLGLGHELLQLLGVTDKLHQHRILTDVARMAKPGTVNAAIAAAAAAAASAAAGPPQHQHHPHAHQHQHQHTPVMVAPPPLAQTVMLDPQHAALTVQQQLYNQAAAAAASAAASAAPGMVGVGVGMMSPAEQVAMAAARAARAGGPTMQMPR